MVAAGDTEIVVHRLDLVGIIHIAASKMVEEGKRIMVVSRTDAATGPALETVSST